MIKISILEPSEYESNPHLVAVTTDNNNSEKKIFFFKVENTLKICTKKPYTNPISGVSSCISYQAEFPFKALEWFTDAIENVFPNTPENGGLPKGQYHFEKVIDGERVRITRPMSLSGKHGTESGYSLVNFDRTTGPGPSRISFTDSLLFEDGLLDLMKNISNS